MFKFKIMAYTKKNGTNQNRRCWGIKKSWFCIILGILTIVVIFLLLNLWFKWIPKIYIDKYVLILVFTLIGLSLLPFAKKIKIANLLEFERLKEKIEKVDTNKYLGQVLRTPDGLYYYYDNNGKHRIPNERTAKFLKSPLGIIQISSVEFDLLAPNKEPIEDIDQAKRLMCGGHCFVILNGKKYWVSVSNLVDFDWMDAASKKPKGFEEVKLVCLQSLPSAR